MKKFSLLTEHEAEEFVSNANKGQLLIQEFRKLKSKISKSEVDIKRLLEIEIELSEIDNWFEK